MFERIPRWRLIIGVSVGVAALGVWFLTPVLLVAAMIPLGFVAYGALTTAVSVDDQIQVTRSMTPTQTYPGGTVDVELTIEHVGETPTADLRVVDGVPDALSVVTGSPRAALGLRPGDTATIEYTVRARSGEFEFAPPRLRTTSLSGAQTYTTPLTADGDRQLLARFGTEGYPVSDQTTRMVGALTTDQGGEGLEFYGTREYRPGDPLSRIDWRQYAERRELTTVDYRQQEAIEVVVIVDARTSAAVASTETAPTGTELSAHAASEAIDGLLQTRNRVGLVTLGTDTTETREWGFNWVPPGNGADHRHRLRTALDVALTVDTENDSTDTAEAASSSASSKTHHGDESAAAAAGIDTRQLIERLTPRAQVILFSPLCDDVPVDIAQTVQAAGNTVSVCTPDVTTAATAGATLAGVERGTRRVTLRTAGVTVIDWEPRESLALVLERAARAMTTQRTVDV